MRRLLVIALGVVAVAGLAVGGAVLAVGGDAVGDGDRPVAGGDAGAGGEAGASVTPPVAESGWRWESYGTVKVRVPDSWVDATYSHTWSCGDAFGPKGADRTPLVGRPWRGPVPAIGCPPVPVLAERVPHLWFGEFEEKPGITRFDRGWASEVRVVAGVPLSVFSDDAALRRRILDSAERMDGTDPNGCRVARPAVLGDGRRPTGPGLAAIGEAVSIRVCAYSYGTDREPSSFQAGLEISGEDARRLGEALRAAPPGVGPRARASNCEYAGQRDDLLVTVNGRAGVQDVVVRYATCRANGTDDGTTLRRLTAETMLPLSKVLYGRSPVLPILDDLGAR